MDEIYQNVTCSIPRKIFEIKIFLQTHVHKEQTELSVNQQFTFHFTTQNVIVSNMKVYSLEEHIAPSNCLDDALIEEDYLYKAWYNRLLV